MRKTLLPLAAALCAIPAMAQYTTPGEGDTFTLSDLAAIPESGVTLQQEQTFLLSSDLTIASGDILSLRSGDNLLLADAVTITVDGEAAFNPDGTATIRPVSAEAAPKGIILSGKASLANISISGPSIMYTGTDPLIVDHCDFSDINGEQSLYGVIVLSGHSSGSRISNCTFTDCVPGAINTPANLGVGLIIENNTITNVATANGMRPFINVTANASEPVIIRHNTLNGARLTAPGGIGVSNMLNLPGENKVTVEYNTVKDCSWGLNFVGGMDVRIIGNTITDCCWDPDVNGGIAVTMYSIASYPQTVYAQENIFEGNKWGPCAVGATEVNFGKTDDPQAPDFNPGLNVFRNNHHADAQGTDIKVDFCNNSPKTQYAQGNYWNDATTAEEVAATIQDSQFSSSYGPVVYTPFRDPSSVGAIKTAAPIAFDGHMLTASTPDTLITITDISGRSIASARGTIATDRLPKGIYIARAGSSVIKFRN